MNGGRQMKIRKGKSEKVSVTVSVDKENLEIVRAFTDRAGVSFSWLFDTYLSGVSLTIRTAKLLDKPNLTKIDLLRVALSGVGVKD